MEIREVMSRPVVTIGADAVLSQALERLWWSGVRHLPVMQSGVVVGVLTRKDVIRHRTDPAGLRTPVRDAMTPIVITAAPNDELTAAEAKMAKRHLGCLPVVEGGDLVGIVTTSDLLARLVRGPDTVEGRGPPVAEVMTRDLLTAHADDRLLDAVAKMSQHHVRHLPVVDGDGRLLGILGDRDARVAVGDPVRALGEAAARTEVEALRVGDVMQREVVTVEPDERLSAVVFALVGWRVGAVPVVDPDMRLLGIVSYVDVLERMWGSGRA